MAANDVTDVPLDEVKNRVEFDLNARYPDQFITTKIGDAVAKIVDDVPTVPGRLRSGALSTASYYRIVTDVVMRVLRNPGGHSTESEGGASWGTNAIVASGTFWLTADDLATLRGVPSSSMPRTVSMGLDGWVR